MINLSESLVAKIWQNRLPAELVTEDGEPIRIIYPGRINDDQGADFRDAVIATSRGLIKGDIEVHVRSGAWQAHRHYHNPLYNRVILHVVMWHDIEAATNLQSGENAPIVVLSKYIKSQWSNLADTSANLGLPCLKAVEHMPSSTMAKFLDSAGEKRFLAKASRFQEELAKTEPGQCLYQGIMGALGYSKNKIPFLELARKLPLQIVESIAQDKISDEECLARQQALLLGSAGLFPSQRPDWHQDKDEWIDKLERLWTSYRRIEAMSLDAWHLFRVRPNNFPVRRIIAMSYLIVRYREKGMFKELVNLVKEVLLSRGCYRLEQGLLVTTNGYWASHFDFGSGRIKSPTLLGRSRAADIVVNVLLPFAFAWGRLTSQIELQRKAFDLYRRYPRLVANTVERHMMKQLGLNTNLVNSAQRQQGLIHIYNSLCTQGRCNCCPLKGD